MGSKITEVSFATWIQPLGDMTKNMELDLVTNLENYIQFIRENNVENFSIAALLVQSSVQIYVKKVDFLFQLVVELHHIITKNRAKQDKENKEGEAAEKNNVEKKKKKTPSVPTDELQNLEIITLEKDTETVANTDDTSSHKKLIPLNGSTNAKSKVNSFCYVHAKKSEILGRKDEFNLHWRICLCGTMVKEFSSDYDQMIPTQVWLNDTVEPELEVQESNLPNGVNDISIGAQDEHHSFEQEHQSEECLEQFGRMNRPDENVVNAEEIQELQWKPVDENAEITEKPINRKKVAKVPEEIQALEAKKENKRKWTEFKMILNNYDITYFLVMERYKKQNVFNFDEDLSSLERKEMRLQKQLILKRRIRFNEMLAREAKQDLCGDFLGFCDMEPDGGDGFAGFDEDDDDANRGNCDNNNLDIDVPLPEQEVFHEDGAERVLDDSSYEDEARRALQEYRMMKNKFLSRETDLSKRVAAWHRTITPKLEAAEERAHFDIHEYGSKILDKFPKSNGKFTLPFSDIVQNEPPEEVARYFLSSLMLANTYNVEISKTDPKELSVDCTTLTLLSRVRHYEELDDNMRVTSNEKH